jgi:hypothetical protein
VKEANKKQFAEYKKSFAGFLKESSDLMIENQVSDTKALKEE